MKVIATEEALGLIKKIQEKHGPDLLFQQSGGCCDGSSPMCFPVKEFKVGNNDVLVGEIGGMFSLDNGTGMRFLTRSEICEIPKK
ncbi:DUF779 domain-containing protein [Bacteriovoracales bacterium]|nr:DUF779 domain-containing protein [Bacteriovoracales bacterium]